VVGDEVRDRRVRLAAIAARLRKLGGYLLAYVARPTLGRVESDDANGG
jgi:hypothetical protein